MTTPTPERPTVADDLDQAYAQAHALAGGDRGPAASVRANVLAAAREIATKAAAVPPLTPVAAPVSDVGRGRAGAWNLSSWRVRSGAAICAVLLVGLAVVRFDASRHGAGNVMVAAADAPLSVQVVPASPPPPAVDLAPPPKTAMPGVVAREHVAAAAALVEVAPAAKARAKADATVAAIAAPRDPERVVAQADKPAAAVAEAPNARADRSTVIAGLEPPALAYAPASPAPAPIMATAAPPAAVALQRVEVTGGSFGLSSAATSQALHGSAVTAKKVSPSAVGSAIGAALRAQPTPLHVAAIADDVDALGKLLADPATRVDAVDTNGRTALMVAVMAANVRAVRMLLDAGADPEHADSTGATPRSLARTGVSAEIAALLAARR